MAGRKVKWKSRSSARDCSFKDILEDGRDRDFTNLSGMELREDPDPIVEPGRLCRTFGEEVEVELAREEIAPAAG